MPPLILGLPGTAWIRFDDGRWNISTYQKSLGPQKQDTKERKQTVSELKVFGTAMRSSSMGCSSGFDDLAMHCANEQKFIVFT